MTKFPIEQYDGAFFWKCSKNYWTKQVKDEHVSCDETFKEIGRKVLHDVTNCEEYTTINPKYDLVDFNPVVSLERLLLPDTSLNENTTEIGFYKKDHFNGCRLNTTTQCRFCYFMGRKLVEHTRTKHPDMINVTFCEICDLVFSSEHHLRKHNRLPKHIKEVETILRENRLDYLMDDSQSHFDGFPSDTECDEISLKFPESIS